MKNDQIYTFCAFLKLNIMIYLSLMWGLLATCSLILYVFNKYVYSWYIILSSSILIVLLIFLSKRSKQILKIYKHCVEVNIPENCFKFNYKKIKHIIFYSNLSNIYIDSKVNGSIVIEYDSEKIYLKYFPKNKEIISIISNYKDKAVKC